ncbi:hypothetical protein [Streptomyces sp. NPDC059743]|uniref:hypothetical protein n=1 Tax=Streptomyces sp. NPDC059743 TaxID=3346928 RepID=UPI003660BB23
MSMWRGAKARRAAGAALATMALAVSLTACGSGGDDSKGEGGGASSSAPAKETPQDTGGTTVPDTSQTLATINGSNGFQFIIHTAVRDDGGFLTVTGSIKNISGKRQVVPSAWNGDEKQVRQTGRSLAGMTLVDKVEKKRYYVLRDTDGYPLTTTGIVGLDADETVSFFAQFPAPPDSTTKVDLQFPTLNTATIEIS